MARSRTCVVRLRRGRRSSRAAGCHGCSLAVQSSPASSVASRRDAPRGSDIVSDRALHRSRRRSFPRPGYSRHPTRAATTTTTTRRPFSHLRCAVGTPHFQRRRSSSSSSSSEDDFEDTKKDDEMKTTKQTMKTMEALLESHSSSSSSSSFQEAFYEEQTRDSKLFFHSFQFRVFVF